MSPVLTPVQCQVRPIVLSPVFVFDPSPSTVFSVYASASVLQLLIPASTLLSVEYNPNA